MTIWDIIGIPFALSFGSLLGIGISDKFQRYVANIFRTRTARFKTTFRARGSVFGKALAAIKFAVVITVCLAFIGLVGCFIVIAFIAFLPEKHQKENLGHPIKGTYLYDDENTGMPVCADGNGGRC